MPAANDRRTSRSAGGKKRLVDQDAAFILDVSKQPKGQKIKVAVRANPNDLTGWLTACRAART
jgi:hypothetical protein